MKNKVLRISGFVLLICLLAFSQSYQGKGKIRGFVYDEEGKPISRVRVKLFSHNASSGFNTETDKNGEWRAFWIRGGKWDIDFDKIGYEPKKISVDVNEWQKNPDVEIKLKKIEGLILSEEIKSALERGNSLFDEKQYQEAIKVYEDILRQAPDAYIIYLNIGHCYFQMEDYELAIENYKKILDKKPDDKYAMLGIGNSYLNMGQKDEALSWYLRIDFDRLDDPIALYNMGNTFFGSSLYEESLKYYKKAIQLQEDFLEARYQLGVVLIALGKNDEALQEFETYLKYDSESERAGQVRGFIDYLKKK